MNWYFLIIVFFTVCTYIQGLRLCLFQPSKFLLIQNILPPVSFFEFAKNSKIPFHSLNYPLSYAKKSRRYAWSHLNSYPCFLGPSPSAFAGKKQIQSTETYKNVATLRPGFSSVKRARWWSRVLIFFSGLTDKGNPRSEMECFVKIEACLFFKLSNCISCYSLVLSIDWFDNGCTNWFWWPMSFNLCCIANES